MGGEPSAVKAARAQTALAETYWPAEHLRRLLHQAQMLDHSVVKRLLPQPLPTPWFVAFQVCWQRGEEMRVLLILPPRGLQTWSSDVNKVCVLQAAL